MIRRFLDCSSGHLSPETWSWLDTNLAVLHPDFAVG